MYIYIYVYVYVYVYVYIYIYIHATPPPPLTYLCWVSQEHGIAMTHDSNTTKT